MERIKLKSSILRRMGNKYSYVLFRFIIISILFTSIINICLSGIRIVYVFGDTDVVTIYNNMAGNYFSSLPNRNTLRFSDYLYVFYRNSTDSFLWYKQSPNGGIDWFTVGRASHIAITDTANEVDTLVANNKIVVTYASGSYEIGGNNARFWARVGVPTNLVTGIPPIVWSTQVEVSSDFSASRSGYFRGTLCNTTNNWYIGLRGMLGNGNEFMSVVYKSTNQGVSWTNVKAEICVSSSNTYPIDICWYPQYSDGVVVVIGPYNNLYYQFSYSTDGTTFSNFADITNAGKPSGTYVNNWAMSLTYWNSEVQFAYTNIESGGSLRYNYFENNTWSILYSLDTGTFRGPCLINVGSKLMLFFSQPSIDNIIYYKNMTTPHNWEGTQSWFTDSAGTISGPNTPERLLWVSNKGVPITWYRSVANDIRFKLKGVYYPYTYPPPLKTNDPIINTTITSGLFIGGLAMFLVPIPVMAYKGRERTLSATEMCIYFVVMIIGLGFVLS